MSTTYEDDTALRADWRRWHDAREEALGAPHGWLSVTALHWLDATARDYPDLPGTWRGADGVVEVTAGPSDDVAVDGRPVDGTARVEPPDGVPGPEIAVGDRRVEVLRREHHLALRVRDPEAPARAAFRGLPTYPVSAGWIVDARFEPATPRRIDVDTVIDGLAFHPTVVGTVRFDLDGRPQELVALAGSTGGDPSDGLKLHFRDDTNGDTTFAGGRMLTTDAPAPDGTLRLDLNRAVHMPCVLSPWATCPLPPAGNTVSARVEAGETLPASSSGSPGTPGA